MSRGQSIVFVLALFQLSCAEFYEDVFAGFILGCPTATICTELSSCDVNGVFTRNAVELDENAPRRPLTPCRIGDKRGPRGVCCVDPFYNDPWPNGDGFGCPGRNYVS